MSCDMSFWNLDVSINASGKHMHEMVDIPQIFQSPPFNRLFILSEINTFTAEEYNEYQKSLTRMSDYYNIIDSAEKRAREEGREEGKLSTARNLLGLGVDVEIIAKATGLSVEDVLLLRS